MTEFAIASAAAVLNQLASGQYPGDDDPAFRDIMSHPAASMLADAIRKVSATQKQLEMKAAAEKRPMPLCTPPAENGSHFEDPEALQPRTPTFSALSLSDPAKQTVVGSKQVLIGSETADNIGLQSQVRLLNDQLFRIEQQRVASAQEYGAVISSLEQQLAKSKQDIEDFLEALRTISEVTKSVAKGDLSQKINIQAKGVEILELKSVINAMVDRLRSFASQVTRVATEVGTEGILGGQAELPDVEGTWLELTTSVNEMAANLTIQVRSIAEVTTAVAQGDLSREVKVDARGEVLALKNTINGMVYSLRDFADQVNRVAKEVGTEGRLGGQAHIEGVSGCWRELSDNVNTMASNLTNQVRFLAWVSA